MENIKLTEKLNKKIAELESENKMLLIKIEKYEKILDDAEKAKNRYDEALEECKKLSERYKEAVDLAMQSKKDYTDMMKKEVENFRKKSAGLLKSTRKQYT